jgi:hypothetical protein
VMDSTLALPPSTLLHNAGIVGAQFGEVTTINIGTGQGKRGRGRVSSVSNLGILDVQINVNFPINSLLLDQERVAKTFIESTPWVKYIEKPSGSGAVIKVGLKVK